MNTRIPIFLSSDDNYVAYMTALMVSIMDNTKSDVDFYVIDANISSFNKKQITSLQRKWNFGLEFIKAEAYRDLFPLPVTPGGHITRASSDRFLVPHMKPELDKAIVLDVDMIALGDIQELWDIDLGGMLLAAVPVYCWTSMREVNQHRKVTGMSPKHVYFNMGTVVVDCKKWRDDNILKRLSATPIKFDSTAFCWWDEILLNMILQPNNYKIIDPKFNMMVSHQAFYKYGKPSGHAELIEDYAGLSRDYQIEEIVISHYAMSHVKPWNTDRYYYPPVDKWMELPNFKEFWYYLSLTPFYVGEQARYQTRILHNTVWDAAHEVTSSIPSVKEEKEDALSKYRIYKFLNILTFGLIPAVREKKRMYKKLGKK